MDGKQLKNSILQWAIQGKLVEQNPKDEPAQKLLERIAASRNESESCHPERSAKGTKSKDLKKKNSTPSSRIYRENGVWYEQVGTAAPKDISDEIPFEIPENWTWCRMGNIGSWGAGATPAKGNPAFYQNGEIPWLLTGELNNSIVSETKTKISKLALEKCSLRLCKPGDILIAMYGATIGKLAIAGIELTTNQACCACTVHYDFNKYLFYFLMASKSDLIKRGEGGAQPNISKEKLVNYLMPLPPLAEQKRIVAKLEQVLPLAEEYGAAQEQLDKLNKELPEVLKKSILQEAIQGKLVPQNPKDEPASVLLAKIRKEKESLVKQGKLKKKDLNCDSIAEEDLPFELPSNWEWCRLEDIVWHLSDGTHKTPKYTESGIPFVSVKNMSSGRLSFENTKFVSKEESDILNQRCNPEKGDLLLSKVGTTGIPVIVDVDFQFSLFVSLALIKFFPNLIDSSFFVYLIKSPLVQNQVREHTRGVGNKNWVLNDIAKTIIAIPPLAEQKRIVAKLEQFFKVL